MIRVLAIGIIVLAIVIAAVPQFTDCLSQGRALKTADGRVVPMRCHWTAMAELGLALPLAGAGAIMLFIRRREAQRSVGVLAAVLGAVAILMPTALIGVCASNQMLCNSIMQPTLVLAGTLAVGLGLLAAFLPLRRPGSIAKQAP